MTGERAYLRALLRVWAMTPSPPIVANAMRATLVDGLTKMVLFERERLKITDEAFEEERAGVVEQLAKEGFRT